MKRKLFWWVLAIGLLILTVLALMVVENRSQDLRSRVGPPFSAVDLCYRPQDVITTQRVYDRVTATHIQFVPTNKPCTPLNFPTESGLVYVRLQWRARCPQ